MCRRVLFLSLKIAGCPYSTLTSCLSSTSPQPWDSVKKTSKPSFFFPFLGFSSNTNKVCFLLVVTGSNPHVHALYSLLIICSHQHKLHWPLVLSITHNVKFKTRTDALKLCFHWRITCAISLCTSKPACPFSHLFFFPFCFFFPPLPSTLFHPLNCTETFDGGKKRHWVLTLITQSTSKGKKLTT